MTTTEATTEATPAAEGTKVCILDAQASGDCSTFSVHAVGCSGIAAAAYGVGDWTVRLPAGATRAIAARAIEEFINCDFAGDHDQSIEEYLDEGNGYTAEHGDVAVYPCCYGEECAQRLMLTGIEGIRLLSAFQALTMPSRFFHPTVTHKKAREIIEDMTGLKLVGGRAPKIPREPTTPGGTHLQSYLDWAVSNCHPGGA